MPGFIVRPKPGARRGKAGHPGGGHVGGGGVTIHVADITIARTQGATALGLAENQVDVIPYETGGAAMIVQNPSGQPTSEPPEIVTPKPAEG